ncbi:MAG: hypothetical protein HYS41_03885 [Candidatus Omnitrophica bacterium]|nr:hypothetical protein [Candidatus Omnitrophota bacterium]
MDRTTLIRLLKDGMHYPTGKHRFLVQRCFEITVHPNRMVEVDEYEGYATAAKKANDYFHVGRSVVSLKDGEVTEEPGRGWPNSR